MIRESKPYCRCCRIAYCAAPVFAQQPAPGDVARRLLRDVEDFRAAENKAFEDRKLSSTARPQAKKDAAARSGADNATRSSSLEEALRDLLSERAQNQPAEQQLRDKATALGLAELFGLARQVANDDSTILQQSLITTQFPPPGPAGARRVSAAVLCVAYDADGSGSPAAVGRDPARDDGERPGREVPGDASCSRAASHVESEVIRIGPFTAISDGQFLAYLPNLRTFKVLPRQLPRTSWRSRTASRTRRAATRRRSSTRRAAC